MKKGRLCCGVAVLMALSVVPLIVLSPPRHLYDYTGGALQAPTLVTSFFDIGRGEVSGKYSRSVGKYLSWLNDTLKFSNPMVIFCEEDENNIPEFVRQVRGNLSTKIVILPNGKMDWELSYLLKNVSEILNSSDYKSKMPKLSRIECFLPSYSILMFQKFVWVMKVANENPFNTSIFAWIDAGASRFCLRCQGVTNNVLTFPHRSWLEFLNDGKVTIQRLGSLMKKPVHDIMWSSSVPVAGTIWAGNKESVIQLCEKGLDFFISEMLTQEQCVNNDQMALYAVWQRNPGLFHTMSRHTMLHTAKTWLPLIDRLLAPKTKPWWQ
ncbi:hypothetical protein Pelo_1372 [Pelomyxa schiedti]|nr:hypothetical protein Pelo_1372 [Pelomyxa schiedti]